MMLLNHEILLQYRIIISSLMIKNCRVALHYQTSPNSHGFCCFTQPIQTYPMASNSVILSAAAFILHKFPHLPHPRQPELKIPSWKEDSQYPSLFLSLHPLFDKLVEVLGQSFFEGNTIREGNTLYVKANVCPEFVNVIMKNGEFHHCSMDKDVPVNEIFKLGTQHKQKRIGWINCSTSQITPKTFNPTMNTVAILLGQVYNNEKYYLYNILKGQVPTVEQLLALDTLIIPGSGLSVLDSPEDIEKVTKNMVQAYKKSDKLKILGICYGHQLMAQAFGAEVVKRQRYGGIQMIKFQKERLKLFQFLKPLQSYDKPNLNLSEHHEDFVTTVPNEYIQLAVSDSCENEAFVSKNGRIFSMQFHPQYCYPFAKAYTARVQVYYSGKIQNKPKYSHSKENLEAHLKSCGDLRACIMGFL